MLDLYIFSKRIVDDNFLIFQVNSTNTCTCLRSYICSHSNNYSITTLPTMQAHSSPSPVLQEDSSPSPVLNADSPHPPALHSGTSNRPPSQSSTLSHDTPASQTSTPCHDTSPLLLAYQSHHIPVNHCSATPSRSLLEDNDSSGKIHSLIATTPPHPPHQHCPQARTRTLSAYTHAIQTTVHISQSPHQHRVPRQLHKQTKDDHMTTKSTQAHRPSSKSERNLIILQVNINGIKNKLQELKPSSPLKQKHPKYITSPPCVPIGCTRQGVGSSHPLDTLFSSQQK